MQGWRGWTRRAAGALARSGLGGARERVLGLALQGGGAHGAYTWGVLDALLAHGGLQFDAVSGTSAGAVNAVALADGLARGGLDGARESLDRLWTAIGSQVPFEWLTHGEGDALGLAPAARAVMQFTRHFSPYQLNPLGLNPLRDLLGAQIDFERLREASPLRLHLAATHVNTGHLRLFREHELRVETVLASACLPQLHQAVEIDGEPYWDGGYSANPALFPLIHGQGSADLMMVLLTPLAWGGTPRSVEAIQHRAMEIGFNAAFLREVRMLARARAVAGPPGWRHGPLERRLLAMRYHLIHADEHLGGLRGETRLIAWRPFLESLRDRGRERAQAWLDANVDAVGRHSTVDLDAAFG